MISAHLDTVFCFTSLAWIETMGPRGGLKFTTETLQGRFCFCPCRRFTMDICYFM